MPVMVLKTGQGLFKVLNPVRSLVAAQILLAHASDDIALPAPRANH